MRNSGANSASSSAMLQGLLERRELGKSDFFVVSTNYDLVIESLLENVFGPDSYYYPGISTEAPGNRVPILKLHGSINWMENRGSAAQRGFSRPTRPVLLAAPSKMQLGQVSADDGVFFKRDGAKYTPIIVPFMLQKAAWLKNDNQQWRRVFDHTWQVAERGMRASTTLLFWGYGLPAADYLMFSLLHEVLEHANARCEVVDKGEIGTNMIRLGRLFGARTSIFQDGLESYLRGQ